MFRTARIVAICRAGAAVALVALFAACPSGVMLKRGGPCGRALCECTVSVEDGAPKQPPCCLRLRVIAPRISADIPIASNMGARWALQELFAPGLPGQVSAFQRTDEDPNLCATGSLKRAHAVPACDVPTPPPRLA